MHYNEEVKKFALKEHAEELSRYYPQSFVLGGTYDKQGSEYFTICKFEVGINYTLRNDGKFK